MLSKSKKLAIDKALYAKLEKAARARGYASTEEMIVHILEREADKSDSSGDREQAEKQLRGLGYLE